LERRLAAILAADAVGYTSLMGADEAGTLRRFTELRQDVLEPLIAEHRGRVVKLMGDGFLVEFASVVDALTCALAWQAGVAGHQATAADDQRFDFRIGINLGDVIVDGDDIHGDGVNVASRLEGLAEPGGICLSDDAYRQVRGKAEAAFEDLGEQALKNVAEPVRVYRVKTAAHITAEARPAGDALALPDKPSIAVLPFDNMSGDDEQEYFADGITEDLITALSKIRWFFVIARNSTFTYKGQAVEVTQVARDLGVRYVIEGSVRKAGNRVRITAQLIDATTGRHVWAERYDRLIEDIFELQDEMTQTIVGAVEPELSAAERENAVRLGDLSTRPLAPVELHKGRQRRGPALSTPGAGLGPRLCHRLCLRILLPLLARHAGFCGEPSRGPGGGFGGSEECARLGRQGSGGLFRGRACPHDARPAR
jgi:adenylate cyclase